MLDHGWMVQWCNVEKQQKWRVGVPQFKHCKKRKECFTPKFSEIWYKAPYKYNMYLEVDNMSPDENVLAKIDLKYESGQIIQDNTSKNEGVITKNENYFVHHHIQPQHPQMRLYKSDVTLGPFQFNICSYKQDGRKFRMAIHLYIPFMPMLGGFHDAVQTICILLSPPFIIRAKKPIVQPGIKKIKKRKANAEEELPEEEPKKKRKKRETKKKKDKEPQTSQTSNEVKQIPQQPPILNQTQFHTPNNEIITQQMLDQFLRQFDNLDPTAHMQPPNTPNENLQNVHGGHQLVLPPEHNILKAPEIIVNDDEKVNTCVNVFKSLSENHRKHLLDHIIELAYAHEKEFIFRKYFKSGSPNYLPNVYGQHSQQTSPQPNVPPRINMPTHNHTNFFSSPLPTDLNESFSFSFNMQPHTNLHPDMQNPQTQGNQSSNFSDQSDCVDQYFLDFADC
jgi:hypothetical protein